MHTSHCHATYEEFQQRYKPLIRPDDVLSLMRSALRVDAEFLSEYDVLRAYLRLMLANWSDTLLAYLRDNKDFEDRFTAQDEAKLRRMMRLHARRLAAGKFDAEYLDTLEDIALFFIFHDVKSIWIAGAYQKMTRDAIDLVFQRATEKKAIRVRHLMKTLASALAIELNQIQRVYMFYERRQTETLVEDLKSGAFLIKPAADVVSVNIPTLNDAQVAIVQQSYAAVVPQSELFIRAFDRRLADLASPTHALLQRITTASNVTLDAVLGRAIEGLSRPEALAQDLATLGGTLVEFGVDRRECDQVIDILIETLKRASGASWEEETADAWRAVYEALITAMFAAAATRRAPRASETRAEAS